MSSIPILGAGRNSLKSSPVAKIPSITKSKISLRIISCLSGMSENSSCTNDSSITLVSIEGSGCKDDLLPDRTTELVLTLRISLLQLLLKSFSISAGTIKRHVLTNQQTPKQCSIVFVGKIFHVVMFWTEASRFKVTFVLK